MSTLLDGDTLAAGKRCAQVAAVHAADVDRAARFPAEAFAALREARLLGASVPTALGGLGLSVTQIAELCTVLARSCSATAMIFAMHHIQIASIDRHRGDSAWFDGYLREVATRQLLIASITSEVGIGGDMRSSACGLEIDPAQPSKFRVTKQATTISYGAHADDWFATCRRTPDAAPGDQVIVLLRRADTTLTQTSAWDTLGMRGTCSPGFTVTSHGDLAQVIHEFPLMASRTMVPYSHLVWGGVWLGIASDAVDKARAYLRTEARKAPGKTPAVGLRVAELVTQLAMMRALVRDLGRDVEALFATPGADEALTTVGWALRLNQVKISASQAVLELCTRAMQIIGLAAYKLDGPASLGRHLRDAMSASLMIGNDRLHHTNAALLCVFKDDE